MPRITIKNTPLLPPAVAIVVGIFLCRELGVLSSVLILSGILSAFVAWYVLSSESQWLAKVAMACVGFAALGVLTLYINTPPPTTVKFHEKTYVKAHVTGSPTKANPGSRYRTVSATTIPQGHKLQLMIDTSQCVQRGQIIGFMTKPRPLPESGYGGYLSNHGYLYRGYVYRTDSLGYHLTTLQKLDGWRQRQAETLNRADTSAMASSLVLGHKESLDRSLRKSYQRVGMAHVLAVSGLHVGIVFMILNLCLGWLKLFRGGRVWLGAVIIVLMFGYAAMTGFSVSVVRAVVMFSMVQVGIMLSRGSSSLNTLSFAALVILLFYPMSLYDLGFQLSFLAMLSILTLYPWACALYTPRNVVLRWIYTLSLVTLTAQVGTLPLAAYTFGNVPLLGLMMTPLLWLTVPAIIVLGMAFLATGLAPIGAVMAWVCMIQNRLVEVAAAPLWVQIQGIQMSLWVLWAIYGAITISVILLLRISPRKTGI